LLRNGFEKAVAIIGNLLRSCASSARHRSLAYDRACRKQEFLCLSLHFDPSKIGEF